MSDDKKDSQYEIGYGKTPTNSRFKRGTSGNPGGRPKGSRNELPYETVLGKMVSVRQDGEVKQVTAEEAFLIFLAKIGVEQGGAMGRLAMAAIENAEILRQKPHDLRISEIVVVPNARGSVNSALEPLRLQRNLTANTILLA